MSTMATAKAVRSRTGRRCTVRRRPPILNSRYGVSSDMHARRAIRGRLTARRPSFHRSDSRQPSASAPTLRSCASRDSQPGRRTSWARGTATARPSFRVWQRMTPSVSNRHHSPRRATRDGPDLQRHLRRRGCCAGRPARPLPPYAFRLLGQACPLPAMCPSGPLVLLDAGPLIFPGRGLPRRRSGPTRMGCFKALAASLTCGLDLLL